MVTRKKVLVFIPEFPVLTETFIERELSKLVERDNIDLVVVSLKKGRGSLSENLKDSVYYKRLGVLNIPGVLIYVLTHLRSILIVSRELDFGLTSKFYLLFKSVGYSKIFSSFKPDIILTHFMSEPSTIAMIASRIVGIPFAVSGHARDITVTCEYAAQKAKFSKFITICNKSAFYFFSNLIGENNSSNVYLSYHGIDVEKIVNSVPGIFKKADKPVIIGVGRLTEKKGFKYLIDASKELKDRGLDFYTCIIGSGPLYGELKSQIKDLGLGDLVKIVGDNKGISNSEVLTYLRSSDAFVLPSIQTEEGDVDGVANVLLEAGAFKLPIVATDAGSTTEVILNEKTGLEVNQRDSKAIANSIERLLNDKDLCLKLGQNLYIKIQENFNLDKNIEKLEGLLIR